MEYECAECSYNVDDFYKLITHYQGVHPGYSIPPATVSQAMMAPVARRRRNRPSKLKRAARRAKQQAAEAELDFEDMLSTPHPEEGEVIKELEGKEELEVITTGELSEISTYKKRTRYRENDYQYIREDTTTIYLER